jgi:hypothetical protein
MLRIGLVDDDLSVRKALSRLLRANGYYCSTYESGEAALADPQPMEQPTHQTICCARDIPPACRPRPGAGNPRDVHRQTHLRERYPSKETTQKLYDEMEFQRATQAYLWASRP